MSQECVMIECNDVDSLKKLQKTTMVELSDAYWLEIPKLMNAKIGMVGIKKEYLVSEEQFIATVQKLNGLSNISNDNKFVILLFVNLKKNKPKGEPKAYNVILEVPPEIIKCLLPIKIAKRLDSFILPLIQRHLDKQDVKKVTLFHCEIR